MKKNKPYQSRRSAAHKPANSHQQPKSANANANAHRKSAEPFPEDDYLDQQDILLRFKISAKTLYRWRKENLIPFFKIRGKIFYSWNELNRKIQEWIRPRLG